MLCLKIFLRKRDTILSILPIALLVAILASANSIVNYLNTQVEALASLRQPTGRYIIVRGSSISDSKLDSKLLDQIYSLHHVENIMPIKYTWLNLTFRSATIEAPVRGVNNVKGFLETRRASLMGGVAKSVNEAVVGELLANAYSVDIGSEIRLTYNTRSILVTVTGIFRTQTEIDSEVIVPIETIFNLTGEEYISLIEFSLKKGADAERVLADISEILPEDIRVVQVHQPVIFARQTHIQMSNFLSFWSLIICAVIASASYITAARLAEESYYEILLLKVLGARRGRIFALMLLYIVIVAAVSSVLGISAGLVGTQIVSTFLSWLMPGVKITPSLEPWQAAWILLITVISAIAGCLYPAHKATRIKYAEKPL